MYRRKLHLPSLSACVLGLISLVGCSDPMPPTVVKLPRPVGQVELEDCAGSAEWIPEDGGPTPPLRQFLPLPHPAGECPFYRGAWQNFLIATQPDANGEPFVKAMPTIDDVFTSYKPHAKRGTKDRAWLGDIKQAGTRDILIDQNGHTIYYGIHMNNEFVKFVSDNNLQTPLAIQNAPETLFFPDGVVELKSAWQEVDEAHPPDDLDSYITTRAWVPTLSQVGKQIVEDKDKPRDILVRLLALHVVFTLPGHPEFIWGSFEHTDAQIGVDEDIDATMDHRNVAPIHPADQNPDPDPSSNSYYKKDTTVVSDRQHLLYKAGTMAKDGNSPIREDLLTLDPKTQTFPGSQTSIFRMFPASKSNTIDADEAIATLNHNVETLFAMRKSAGKLSPKDKRGNYRLIGAQWLDKPEYFAQNQSFQNDKTSPLLQVAIENKLTEADFKQNLIDNGGDSVYSLTAGEDRLSSTAMESFTQSTEAFPNCFACHNTQEVTAKGISRISSPGDANNPSLLKAKLLNVSHVLTQVVLEECVSDANLIPNPSTAPEAANTKFAVCPPMPAAAAP
jgi:hypothetical protein